MARATKTTRTSAKKTPEPAPKKRTGRPLGSKNRVPAASRAKVAPATTSKRTPVKKTAAPAAPKLNKAELEHQVVKLERTIARLRKQNAELKQTLQEGKVEATKPAPASAAAPSKKPKRADAVKTRRPTKKAAEPKAVSDSDEDDAEAEG